MRILLDDDFGGGGGGIDLPPPPPPSVGPEIDENDLARKRASLNQKRIGTQSLRIDPNPGLSAPANAGNPLGIPGYPQQ